MIKRVKRVKERDLKKSEKGLSTIVATLLIILLTLVAVGIIWIVVRNVIQGGSEQISLGKFTLDLKISQVQRINDSALNITIKRNAGDGDFVGIAFIAEDDSNKETIKRNVSIQELEIKKFQLYFTTINVSRLKKISIAPIFKLKSGKESVGDVKDEYNTGSGSSSSTSGSVTCIPACISPYVCSGTTCVLQSTCTDTCSSLGYNCGTQSVCGINTNCGSCTLPQTCSDGVCTTPSGNCQVTGCQSGEYCFTESGVCLLQVSGNTYFVATNGNDSSSGNFTHPWASFQKAISMTHAGDISYFRGGVYFPTMYPIHDPRVRDQGYDGIVTNPVRFYNYPGEVPVFDNINQTQLAGQRGIVIRTVNYAHYKGLTFRNVIRWGPSIGCIGVWAYNSTNITFENCNVYNVNGHGFFSSEKSNDIHYVNCDSYNNSLGETTEASDGFNAILETPEQKVYFTGCRSWNNSDDGFDTIYGGYAEFNNCWAFNIGPGDGNGFKIVTGANQDVEPLMRKFTNCISAGNEASGFHENTYTARINMHLYNCFSYKNGFAGYYVPCDGTVYPDNQNIYRNNIAYANVNSDVGVLYGKYVHDHNSWDNSVTVTDDDFVSLDVSQLMRPRKADGSLPDITFGHLKADSDLIDKGVDIGIPFSGSAPDLGAFEYASSCNCNSGKYCFYGVCLLNVSGNTYFVATNGNDTNPGNFTHPWGTWQKAFNTADAGDIVYFRGGIWYPKTSVVYSGATSGHNGTELNHIIYENYPGEIPILDLSDYNYTTSMAGLAIHYVTNIEFRGLTIRNNKQDFFGQWIDGLEFYQCGNLWVDRVTSHGHGGYGIWFVGYDKLYLTNSDSYDNVDYLAVDPGNRADGFQISSGGQENDYLYMRGCRSWNNSDDGIEISHGREMEVFDTWSFGNGRLEFGAGQGFKYAGAMVSDPSKRKTHNNIAAFNKGVGFIELNLNNIAYGPIMEYSNNIAYRCQWGFGSSPNIFNCTTGYANVSYKNNLVYNSTYGAYFDQAYLAACWYGYPIYTSYNNNTWIPKSTNPYWQYNPAVTVTNADFVLLPATVEEATSILSAPRKADGSLPEIGNYFHLASGSDLIDKGVNVGLPYNGAAPDLGAFESNY